MIKAKRIPTLLAIGTLTLIGTVAVSGCSDSKSSKSTTTTSAKIGDDVKLDKWTVTVNSVQNPYSALNPAQAAKQGNKLIAVDLTMRNNTKKTEEITASKCISLQDGSGKTYNVENITTSPAAPSGTVAPTAALRGLVAFSVPTDATKLALKFKCDLFAKQTATIPI